MTPIMVHYHCPGCPIDFVVIHQGEQRNTHCCYCGTAVTLTGKVEKIEGDDVVTYQDGVEIDRRLKPELRHAHTRTTA